MQTDWSQFHFDAHGTRLNPYENVLNVGTVGSIDLKWSHREGRIDSAAAIVQGVIYFAPTTGMYALNAVPVPNGGATRPTSRLGPRLQS